MSNQKTLTIWLPKPNIGLIKEAKSLANIARSSTKFHVKFLIGSNARTLVRLLRGAFQEDAQIVFSYNISALSAPILLALRVLRCDVVQCLHEPGMSNKRNYGWLKAIKIYLVERLVWMSQIFSHRIIVFSDQAAGIARSLTKKPVTKLALIPYSKVDAANFGTERDLDLVFIGRIHPAKNFDLFLKLAEEKSLSTAIVTSSIQQVADVDPELLKDSLVIAKKMITDDEIEHILRRTKVVFKLDKNMMQSGLVIQARYHGCMSLVNGIRGFKQDQAFGDLIEVSNPESLPEVFEKLRLSLVSFPNRNEKDSFYSAHSWHLENQRAWEAFFVELQAA